MTDFGLPPEIPVPSASAGPGSGLARDFQDGAGGLQPALECDGLRLCLLAWVDHAGLRARVPHVLGSIAPGLLGGLDLSGLVDVDRALLDLLAEGLPKLPDPEPGPPAGSPRPPKAICDALEAHASALLAPGIAAGLVDDVATARARLTFLLAAVWRLRRRPAPP